MSSTCGVYFSDSVTWAVAMKQVSLSPHESDIFPTPQRHLLQQREPPQRSRSSPLSRRMPMNQASIFVKI
jgi:hypothetical protein